MLIIIYYTVERFSVVSAARRIKV